MPAGNASRFSASILLAIVLCLAAFVRLQDLVTHAFVLDEAWSLEIATGRGSLHQHLPANQIIPPPPFYSLKDAAPWWQIWSHMEVTHPPLYSLLLRGWEEIVGDSDYTGRLFSILLSLIAIAVLFDTVRLQAGTAPAVWAGLLMAFSTPQIEQARLVRSYALLLAVALVAVNALVRIHRLGPSSRRWIMLWVAVFATLLTHYFCLGAIVSLAIWALLILPQSRRQVLILFASVAATFAILWGPFMWGQRHLFATDDASTLFLTTDAAHHVRQTFARILTLPVQMFFPVGSGFTAALAMAAGALIYLLPFVPVLHRRNPCLLLWGLWSVGTVGVVAALDLARGTSHLFYLRYTILLGPAAFAILCTAFAPSSRMRHLLHPLAALALIGCLIYLPDVYNHPDPDPRNIARDLALFTPGPQDVLVFAAPEADLHTCQLELLMLTRYMQPMNCRILVLTHPADAQLNQQLANARYIFLDTQDADPHQWLHNSSLIKARTYRNLGNVFVLQKPEVSN